nr:MAG TPA: hypothetical protein [Caudoviricetes sp.]
MKILQQVKGFFQHPLIEFRWLLFRFISQKDMPVLLLKQLIAALGGLDKTELAATGIRRTKRIPNIQRIQTLPLPAQ